MIVKSRSWLGLLVALVVAFGVAFFWQSISGAYRSEFGGHPDEAAHVVTGLFVRDALLEAVHYASGGFHGSPIRVGKEFAEGYYEHYPKIGLGVWPPFFYLVQSAWTLPLGASRDSLLLLLCGLASILGCLVFRALREDVGPSVALVSACVLLSLPLARSYYGMVMAETLSAGLMFGAALALGNFLDREKRSDALWFGALAALAILTKGTGLALGLAALLALGLRRSWGVLWRPAGWLAALIVVVVAGPWTWATRNLGKGGWQQPNPSLGFTAQALPYYLGKFGLALGFVLLGFFVLGVVEKMRSSGPRPGRWAALGALIVAVIVFQCIAPVGLEARHLIPILPAAVMFAAVGFHSVRRRCPGWSALALTLAVVGGIAWTLLPVTPKGAIGFSPLALRMLAEASPEDVALVSSDATGEGMFIAEVALHEKRPGHVLQRASKSLATSTWNGSGYTPAFDRTEAVWKFLLKSGIRFLVLDDAVPADKRRAHHEQLRQLVEEHPEEMKLVAESEVWRGGIRQPTTAKLYMISAKN